VNEFVEQCRRERKRLRVPDHVADEMAAELAADLEEAQAEHVSPEEVLGSGASDPRAFAAAWAAERGVEPSRARRSKKAVLLVALGALAALAITGAVLVTVASRSTSHTQVAFPPPPDEMAAVAQAIAPPPGGVWVAQQSERRITIELPSGRIALQESGSDDTTPTIGLVLLIVGLAGIVPLAAYAQRV
jgi:hypothetical protein